MDWARFQKYSPRIYELKAHDWALYDASVFAEIAFSRPSLDLFPHLRSVDVEGARSQYISLFSHATISSLRVRVAVANRPDVRGLTGMLSYLPDRTPKLEQLDLGVETRANIPCQLHEVLPRLRHLKTLRISDTLFDADLRVLHSIAQLPKLELLWVSSLEGQRWRDGSHGAPYPGPVALPNSGFPALISLRLLHSLEYAASLIEEYALANLRTCTILSRAPENGHDFVRIFEAVAENCPMLGKLVLDGARSNLQPRVSTHDLLQPLVRCRSLTELYLQAAIPLNLTISSVSSFLKALPAMQTFVLYEDPAMAGPPTLPLSALALLVPICPNMKIMSLYMDTLKHTPITGAANTPYPSLECLDMGLSPLNSSTAEVAAFLSGVLPEGCRLDFHGEDPAISTNYSSWASVANLLPTLIQIRKAERAMLAAKRSAGATISTVKATNP
ncbi:hypothetical protein EYR38_009248 [Pleurotus pulmonarius]|nr:hypothetical protein EYR38_009248 [Pleurotus pulmonarius]